MEDRIEVQKCQLIQSYTTNNGAELDFEPAKYYALVPL